MKNKAADLKTDFSKLSLLNDENNKKMEVVDNRLDGAYGGCEDEKVRYQKELCKLKNATCIKENIFDIYFYLHCIVTLITNCTYKKNWKGIQQNWVKILLKIKFCRKTFKKKHK